VHPVQFLALLVGNKGCFGFGIEIGPVEAADDIDRADAMETRSATAVELIRVPSMSKRKAA